MFWSVVLLSKRDKANCERPKLQYLYKLNKYVCNYMLAVVESMIAIASSKKATNINIYNDLHNARDVCNSLQNKNPNTYRSRALNTSAVIQTKCLIFQAIPSERTEFTKFPIKNFSC